MHFLSLPAEVHLAIFSDLSFDGHLELNDLLPYFKDLARCASLCQNLKPIVLSCLWKRIHLRPCTLQDRPGLLQRTSSMVKALQATSGLARMIRFMSVDLHAASQAQLSVFSTVLASMDQLTDLKLICSPYKPETLLTMPFPALPNINQLTLSYGGFWEPDAGRFFDIVISKTPSVRQINFDFFTYGSVACTRANVGDHVVGIRSGDVPEERDRTDYLTYYLEKFLQSQSGWHIVKMGFPTNDPNDPMVEWPMEGSFEEYLEIQEAPLTQCRDLSAVWGSFQRTAEDWQHLLGLVPNITSLSLTLLDQYKKSYQLGRFITFLIGQPVIRRLESLHLDLGDSLYHLPTDVLPINNPLINLSTLTFRIQFDFQLAPSNYQAERLSDKPDDAARARLAAGCTFMSRATREEGIAKNGRLVLSLYGKWELKLVYRQGKLWDVIKQDLSEVEAARLAKWDWMADVLSASDDTAGREGVEQELEKQCQV